MSRMQAVFKAYDVRGTVPDQLDADMCRAIGRAMARFAGTPEILVARDMRESGVALSGAFSDGVRSEGVDVTDLGLASTDFLYFASGHLDAPGAMFTASHNPAQYNGLKLCLSGARPIGRDTGLAEIEASAEDCWTSRSAHWWVHTASSISSTPGRTMWSPSSTSLRCAHSAWSRTLPMAWGDWSCRSSSSDCLSTSTSSTPSSTATFRTTRPTPFSRRTWWTSSGRYSNRARTSVSPSTATPTASFWSTRKSEPVSGSLTTALVASSMLAKNPGETVLYNLICSHVVPEVIRELGGNPVRTRVGHSFIKQLMAETGAVFGGEHSGHYYYRDNFRADSGIITALIVLELMSRSEQPLSAMLAPYERYADSGEINTEVANPSATVAAMAESERSSGAAVDLLDGLTVEHADWWYNVRPSNTEPLLRLNVEARTPALCAEHIAEVESLIASHSAGPEALRS